MKTQFTKKEQEIIDKRIKESLYDYENLGHVDDEPDHKSQILAPHEIIGNKIVAFQYWPPEHKGNKPSFYYFVVKTISKEYDSLTDFFEEHNFLVYEYNKINAEVEKWTKGGVDMIFSLEPFTKEKFYERVNDFDIDEEIDIHRQGKDYHNAFTITESVKDFTEFHNMLKKVVKELKVTIIKNE